MYVCYAYAFSSMAIRLYVKNDHNRYVKVNIAMKIDSIFCRLCIIKKMKIKTWLRSSYIGLERKCRKLQIALSAF